MTLHLHLACGPYRFVVDAGAVLATWSEGDGGEHPVADANRQEWRGESLPYRDLRDALGLDPRDGGARRIKFVASHDGRPRAILAVDAVLGLVDAAPDEFRPLPPLMAKAARSLFDAVLARPLDGWQLLRLAPRHFPAESPPP